VYVPVAVIWGATTGVIWTLMQTPNPPYDGDGDGGGDSDADGDGGDGDGNGV
jgi:hypothetical protein